MTNLTEKLKEFDEGFKSENGSFDTMFTLKETPEPIEPNDPRYYKKVKSFISSTVRKLVEETRVESEKKFIYNDPFDEEIYSRGCDETRERQDELIKKVLE